MADLAQLSTALINADRAGDVAAAKMLAAEIKRVKSASVTDSYSTDPTEGMSGTSKFLAGAGKAMTDIGRGAGQMLGAVSEDDVDQSKKRDAPLMNTGAGLSGNIVGNIATTAPLAMIPGANTIVGGALIGGATGALQPTGKDDSRLKNVGVGTAAGATIPALLRGLKVGKAALVDPFTEAGRTNIAGNALNSVAADPDAVISKLAQAKGATPGFMPSAGQAANDAGIGALERTMRAIDPQGFDALDKSQKGALIDALRKVAQTPEARSAAVNEAESAVKPLYDSAKKTTVEGDSAIESLLNRPSMELAKNRAAKIAAERGSTLAMTEGSPASTSASSILDEFGRPLTSAVEAKPATMQGQALHDLKMGLDDAIGNPGLGGMQGAERNAALGTKEQFLSWLENKIPAYGQAKATYAEKMRPVNQMDIGKELYNRFVPALADQGGLPFKSTAQSYANALRNGDELARNVTGLKGTTLEKIMEPDQMQALQGVAKDSAMKAAGENIGRGVGSDTVQKMSMSNLANQAGIPNWMASLGRVPGGWAKQLGGALYGNSDKQIQMRLAELLRDPKATAAAMKASGIPPSKIAEFLRIGAQSSAMALPASAQAAE